METVGKMPFKMAFIIDFDGTIYQNDNTDASKDNYHLENLRSEELVKFKRDKLTKIICSGRNAEQISLMKSLIVEAYGNDGAIDEYYLWKDMSPDIARRTNVSKEEIFGRYWKWKWTFITATRKRFKNDIVVFDDDPVIGEMCVKFNIPVVLVDLNHIINKKYKFKYHDGTELFGFRYLDGVLHEIFTKFNKHLKLH